MKAWENNIRKVIPYVPGEQPKKEKMIKLNTNENPYPPAPGVKDVLTSFDTDRRKCRTIWFKFQSGICGRWIR